MSRRTSRQDRWWELPEDSREAAEQCLADKREVEEETCSRIQLVLDSYAMYGHGALGECNGLEPLPDAAMVLGINVIASAVDTWISEVTGQEPRPVVQTVGGDWSDRKRAEKLTAYIEAKYDEADVWGLLRRAAKDAAIAGLGILRAYDDRDLVTYERIHPLNFVVDDRGAIDQAPRVFYIQRCLDREGLAKSLEEDGKGALAEQVRDSNHEPEVSYWHSFDITNDVVEVVEAWRVASYRGAEDGRHMIVAEGCDPILDETYDRPTPPLVFIRAIDASAGFWGEMAVQRAAPAQLELNKLLARIQDSMHLHAVIRAFVQPGAMQASHMQTDLGLIIECAGPPPVFPVIPSMPPDVYQHVDRLKAWAFELIGISELSATMRKPAGLNSEPAQRTYHEFQTRRHINFERSIEHAVCELARETIRCERAIAERLKEDGEKHEIPYASDGALATTEWFDLDIDEQRMLVQVGAASALRRDPAGRLKDIQDLIASMQLPPELLWRVIDDPDLDAIRQEFTAPAELVDKLLDRMLDGGKYTPPEPYMSLDKALLAVALKLQRAEVAGAPESGLEKLRRFYAGIKDLQGRMAEKAAADAAAMAPPMPPMTPGGAMPPMPPEMAGGPAGPLPPGEPMPPAPPGPIPLGA